MSLSDIRIALLLFTVVAVTALISAVFGIRGMYFMLVLHTLMDACFITFSMIANGKI